MGYGEEAEARCSLGGVPGFRAVKRGNAVGGGKSRWRRGRNAASGLPVAVRGGRGAPGRFLPQAGGVGADQAPDPEAWIAADGPGPVGGAVAGEDDVITGQYGAQRRNLGQHPGRHRCPAGEHIPPGHDGICAMRTDSASSAGVRPYSTTGIRPPEARRTAR